MSGNLDEAFRLFLTFEALEKPHLPGPENC